MNGTKGAKRLVAEDRRWAAELASPIHDEMLRDLVARAASAARARARQRWERKP